MIALLLAPLRLAPAACAELALRLRRLLPGLMQPAPLPRDDCPTSVLSPQQLRDAGLETASDTLLRELGIQRERQRIETRFSARRSVR